MKALVLFLLRMYKRIVSPMLGNNCRFYPTCSDYAVQAVEKYGVLKGGWLCLKRISRCHPYHKGGIDEVP